MRIEPHPVLRTQWRVMADWYGEERSIEIGDIFRCLREVGGMKALDASAHRVLRCARTDQGGSR